MSKRTIADVYEETPFVDADCAPTEKKMCVVEEKHDNVVISDIFDSVEIYLFERLTAVKSKEKNEKSSVCLSFFFPSNPSEKALLKLWCTAANEVVCYCCLVLGSNQISGCVPGTHFHLQLPGSKHFACARNEIISLAFSKQNMTVTCKKQGVGVTKYVPFVHLQDDNLALVDKNPSDIISKYACAVRFQMPFSHVDTVWSALQKSCKPGSDVVIKLLGVDQTKTTAYFTGIHDKQTVLSVNFEKDLSIQSSLRQGCSAEFVMQKSRFEKLAELCKIKKSSKGRFLPFSGYLDSEFTTLKIMCIDPGVDQECVPLCLMIPISKNEA